MLSATPWAGQKRAALPPPPPSIAPLELARLLDTYAAGRFDDALRQVAVAGDTIGRNLRAHWSVDGPLWIDADPSHRQERLLAVAAFALETEHIRVERGDWGVTSNGSPCAGPCVLDWAQARFIERGEGDDAERAWYLAAAALASGVRDWRYLQRPANPRAQPPVLPGLMDRALVRFPEDASLKLEQALAAAGRFNVTIDGQRSAVNLGTTIPFPIGMSARGLPASPSRVLPRDLAVSLLSALVDDGQVGAEARLRLGYLRWVFSEDAEAQAELTRAVSATHDPDDLFLAEFLLGWIAMARADSSTAVTHLEAALAARPDSQSAAVALAALCLQQGDAARAHGIAQASLERRSTDLDPWRLFLYGHYPRFSSLVTQLRRDVHP